MAFAPPRPEHDKSITLFIQGHGQTPIPYKDADTPAITRLSSKDVQLENVTVLSVVGDDLVESEMGLCFPPEFCNKTTDAMIGTELWKVYKRDTRHIPSKKYYKEKLKDAADAIRELNEAASIHYPRGYSIEDNPVLDREYFFVPEPHESHRLCVKRGDARCIRARHAAGAPVGDLKHNLVWCPDYGLYALDATDIATHTIASIPKPPMSQYKESKITPEGIIDIRPKNILRSDQYSFWKRKIIDHWRGNPDTDRRDSILLLLREAHKYDELSLREISTIFQEGMGYKYLHVVDGTCKTPFFEPDECSQTSNGSSSGSEVGSPGSSQPLFTESESSQLSQSSQPSQLSLPPALCLRNRSILKEGGGKKKKSRKRLSRNRNRQKSRRTRRKRYTRRRR